MAGTLLRKLSYAEHLGSERGADGIQQVAQWRIVRPFVRTAAGRPDVAQIGKVFLNRSGELFPSDRHTYTLPQRERQHVGADWNTAPVSDGLLKSPSAVSSKEDEMIRRRRLIARLGCG